MSNENLQQQNLYGQYVSDSDESLKSKAGGSKKFGLNQGYTFSKFEYNPNASKDGSPNPALDINLVDKDGSLIYYTIYGDPGVLDESGVKISDTNSQEYQEGLKKNIATLQGVLSHFSRIVLPEEEYKKRFSEANITGPESLLQFVASVMAPAVINKTPVDVFLQYQWDIKKGQDRTYLELPKNLKDGYFITKGTQDEWTEVRNEEGLKYINSKGEEHVFNRKKSYLEDKKAIQQTRNGATSSQMSQAARNMNASSTQGTAGGNW